MECLYCHFGADKGEMLGYLLRICLNCHNSNQNNSPEIQKVQKAVDSGENVQWVKVNHYPDFAYFNHAQHVNVAGFDCQKCHGQLKKWKFTGNTKL